MDRPEKPPFFAIGCEIDRTTDDEGHRLVRFTFRPARGAPARVVMLWSEAQRLSEALAEDVRLNDPFRESRERYQQPDED
jgi:hypothetical protein